MINVYYIVYNGSMFSYMTLKMTYELSRSENVLPKWLFLTEGELKKKLHVTDIDFVRQSWIYLYKNDFCLEIWFLSTDWILSNWCDKKPLLMTDTNFVFKNKFVTSEYFSTERLFLIIYFCDFIKQFCFKTKLICVQTKLNNIYRETSVSFCGKIMANISLFAKSWRLLSMILC